ncbi:MAG: hypothetical protein LOY02_19005, partial [Intrasporangium sp.]|nr:hypothetical protein [Intrasporangium sp.]
MSKRSLMPYAAGLLLVLTLAGCAAGDGTAAPQATTPAPRPSTPSASVSTSVAPSTPIPAASTSATPDFPDGLPAAAKKRTKEGAKAFVEHFI